MLILYNISYGTYERRSQEIGERIRTERKKLDLTQDGLAEKIDIGSRQTIAQWENGVALPPLSKLLCMCDLFGCEIGYLLCDYDCKTRTATDIHKEIGLSEVAISKLSPLSAVHGMRLYSQPTKDRQTALNAILGFNDSDILELIHEYLYRDEEAVELKDGRILSPETIIESYMLEINAELKILRNQIKGGSDNGQH